LFDNPESLLITIGVIFYDLGNRNVAPNFLNRQFLYYRYMSPLGFDRKKKLGEIWLSGYWWFWV